MMEVELKALIANKAEIERRLVSMHSARAETVTYHDVYFDTPAGEFRRTERELRIREISGDASKVLLTYKDRPFDKASKSKQEYEVGITDYSVTCSILRALGFDIDIEFSKHCQNFEFTVENFRILATLVHIDELRRDYIEIETLVDDGAMFEHAMQKLQNVLHELGIHKECLTSEYYTDMIRQVREE